ncbi:oocyte-secreted protein 3 [Oryctolagus cuniculus]|uniref:oocyte-secreted protein 3 n=1 Tax=Oryctolagus cuniculus TaxID=9986 RepID=UPI00387A1CDC
MKLLMVLGELLLLLVSLMWTCSGQQPVLLECSHFYFRATVKRALFYENELVGPDELFLGTGCPATQVRPYELKFDYPLNLCGIVKQVFFDRVVIHSWLTYTPRNRSFSAELHLQCMVPSTYVVRDNNVMSMPDENWFLIQNRYCAMCRSAHFRDNWVRLPTRAKLSCLQSSVL